MFSDVRPNLERRHMRYLCKQIFYHFSLFLWWWCKMSCTHFQSDKKTGWEMVPLNTFLVFHFWKQKTVNQKRYQIKVTKHPCIICLFIYIIHLPFLSKYINQISYFSSQTEFWRSRISREFSHQNWPNWLSSKICKHFSIPILPFINCKFFH